MLKFNFQIYLISFCYLSYCKTCDSKLAPDYEAPPGYTVSQERHLKAKGVSTPHRTALIDSFISIKRSHSK